MFKPVLRSVIAVLVCSMVLALVGFLGAQLFGHAMLQAVDWQPGMPPPSNYVWFTLAKDLVGSTMAGVILAWIAQKWPYKTAAMAIILQVVIRANQYASALDPHWYAFVLILTPIAGILLGVRIYARIAAKSPTDQDSASPT